MLFDECDNYNREQKTIWMINSTRDGGGVAEMLPNIVRELRNKEYQTRWLVLSTERTQFFGITKALHNMIHDNGLVESFTESDREVFELVAQEAATSFATHLKSGDIVLVHDPQPSAMIKFLKT